ncbi:hypothetical protein C7999DRAFT_13970 [Corynascus novoguineensis]|uniref:Uncharacterized protein n=1 Tax=Corynascus novoguineensis TaxID=1126955 RepID=A0AAN7CTE6_9PEZI|nr:hypothetical protein C7999DRAFT_13970 [Corynascus novoguineensis]
MSVFSTLPTGSKSNNAPPNTRIARVTLSNGYRAYHPQIDGTNKPPKQKKTVRFVKGYSVDESIALTEAGSDLDEFEGEVDYDFLRDLSLDEAEGWVPVMVAEDEEGDDWMSLTGSWMRMSVVGDAQK